MIREYDFVLIGPNIGVIVIEVKSSYFTQKKDFTETNKHLPDHIVKGLKQLDSFDSKFLRVCSGTENTHEIPIRKILFTPNLEKRRFDNWYSRLDWKIKERTKGLLDGVTHWFKEDISNGEDTLKPPLYNTLHRAIEAAGFQIPHKIYESYGLVISGLASAIVLQNQPTVCTDRERLSTSSAILRDAAALESHDPLHRLKLLFLGSGPKRLKRTDINPDSVIELDSKLILLTPEQQAALNGPNRQFIIGAPGTGKTIILQAKALQLLREGKRVFIDTARSFSGKYQKLFKNHGFTNYVLDREIRSLLDDSIVSRYMSTPEFIKALKATDEPLWRILDFVPESLKRSLRNPLKNFDAILIDDALDEDEESTWGVSLKRVQRLTMLLLLMSMANERKFCSKVVWVAHDSSYRGYHHEYVGITEWLTRAKQEGCFTCSRLDRVMRSSESVYHAVYSQQHSNFFGTAPILGHKIHGFFECLHIRNLPVGEARLKIWQLTETALKKFRQEGFEFGQMAVIADSHSIYDCVWKKFKEDRIPVANAGSHSPSSLTVDKWKKVSSFEWPIVIYIAWVDDHEGLASAYLFSSLAKRGPSNYYTLCF